jgi:hypothetical protein
MEVLIMKKIPLLAWYFPNWHPDPRNDEWHGRGWTEWEVSKCSRPRFPGHDQPKVPLWGYEDESDPVVMEKKIDTALAYGIDGFLWDMYWFEDGGYRLNALDKGFFGAKNNEKFKIALMWCNHDPIYVHPASRRFVRPQLMPGELSPEAFKNGSDYFIKNYFWRPNYLRVDDKIFFVLWDMQKLIKSYGGLYGTRLILNDFRKRVADAGLGELFLACEGSHLESYGQKDRETYNKTLKYLGIDGTVSYSWPLRNDKWPSVEYDDFMAAGIKKCHDDAAFIDLPASFTVSNGWDSSPRTVQSEMYEPVGYPFSPVVVNNTPEKFEEALRAARDFVENGKFTGKFVTLSTWNEWTEGNFLEPSAKYGYQYLEAVKRVFVEEE